MLKRRIYLGTHWGPDIDEHIKKCRFYSVAFYVAVFPIALILCVEQFYIVSQWILHVHQSSGQY